MRTNANEQFITCPECGKSFQLTQALISNIETDLKQRYQKDFDEKLKAREMKVKSDTEKALAEKFEADLIDLKNQVEEKEIQLKEATAKEEELKRREEEVKRTKQKQ